MQVNMIQETATVDIHLDVTMEDTITEDIVMVDITMEDTIMEDIVTEDTIMEVTITDMEDTKATLEGITADFTTTIHLFINLFILI